MDNIPPRMGKTRTLVLFCAWMMGVILSTKVIACSYNDTMASDFSRYTRDTISQQKTLPHDITHNDIFPESRIKYGNASFERWAQEGQYFNYLGAGVGGSITGKGGDVLLSDDLVKDAYEAYNSLALDKKWLWYTGTFQSRGEQADENTENLEIMNGTRWALDDPCGRNLKDDDVKYEQITECISIGRGKSWYVIKMEAMKNGELLCPSLLNLKRYLHLKKTMDPAIFRANYHQEPVDIVGRLYPSLLTYTDLPHDAAGNLLYERIAAYCDSADTGNDYLCLIVFLQYRQEAYILDVYYTKSGMEITEPGGAEVLYRNKVNYALFESNAGGRGYARAVRRLLQANHGSNYTRVNWFAQTKNKQARILSTSNYVMQHIFFPVNWKDKWPDFYDAVTSYQKEGKNDHDDAPDALTGVAEMIEPATVAQAGPKVRR